MAFYGEDNIVSELDTAALIRLDPALPRVLAQFTTLDDEEVIIEASTISTGF